MPNPSTDVALQSVGANDTDIFLQAQDFTHFIELGDIFFSPKVSTIVSAPDESIYHLRADGIEKNIWTISGDPAIFSGVALIPESGFDKLYVRSFGAATDGTNVYFSLLVGVYDQFGNAFYSAASPYILRISQDLTFTYRHFPLGIDEGTDLLDSAVGMVATSDGSLWVSYGIINYASGGTSIVVYKLLTDENMSDTGELLVIPSHIPIPFISLAVAASANQLALFTNNIFSGGISNVNLLSTSSGSVGDPIYTTPNANTIYDVYEIFGVDTIPSTGEIVEGLRFPEGDTAVPQAMYTVRNGVLAPLAFYGPSYEVVSRIGMLRVSADSQYFNAIAIDNHVTGRFLDQIITTFQLIQRHIDGSGNLETLWSHTDPVQIAGAASTIDNSFIIVRPPFAGAIKTNRIRVSSTSTH